MINKKIKAQVTAFIIIGILIIAIIWMALVLSDIFTQKKLETGIFTKQTLNSQSNAIKENIDSCIETHTDKGIQLMSNQGLYVDIPKDLSYDKDSAYWIVDTANTMPSSFEEIEKDLSAYINNNIKTCVSFNEFIKNGWQISNFNPSTNVDIFKQDINVEVDYNIIAKKQDFERKFSNSIYTPNIRFKQMYNKSVDFVNNQLLRSDFDIEDPLKDYNDTGYKIGYEELDEKTLLFSITDMQSKQLDGKPFTLKFVASFDTNYNFLRTYDVGDYFATRTLYSPDKLAVLVLPSGVHSSNEKITIKQYEKDYVTRYNTPIAKVNKQYIGYRNVNFPTRYPIYSFNPRGNTFSSPVVLNIFLNNDQNEIPDDYSLLYNGQDGWIPYPHVKDTDTGTISSIIYGFSEFTPVACEDLPTETAEAIAEEERSFWEAYMPIIAAILALIVMWHIPGFGIKAVTSGMESLVGLTKIAYTVAVVVPTFLIASEFTRQAESDKTIVFTAKCDDKIAVSIEDSGGEGHCIIVDTVNKQQTDVSSNYYNVKAGQTYTLTAGIELDNFETEGSCKCTASGSITTNNAWEHPMEEVPEPEEEKILVCCITHDGFCLDNYMEDMCHGSEIEKICSEVLECSGEPPLSGDGNLIITQDGNAVNFGVEGESFLVAYYLPSATKNTRVIAHIKVDGTKMVTLELYDDGIHDDNQPSDMYYANIWKKTKILGVKNSADITWDIEIIYGDVKTVTKRDIGSMLLISNILDCQPLIPVSVEAPLDIVFASNRYIDINKFSEDVQSTASKILTTEPFSTYYNENSINIHQVNNLFSTHDLSEIKAYSNTNCGYGEPQQRLTIVLNNNIVSCVQDGYIVELNPLFTFNPAASSSKINTIISNFCDYIDELAFMNPPVPEILTQNIITIPSEIPIDFKITDEEYPVEYEFMWNYVTLIKAKVEDDSIHTHTLNLPNGNWIIQIKATDQRGNTGYSNVLSIITNDTIIVDFSSISQVDIPPGSSKTINLNEHVLDPRGDGIIEWVHYPGFSDCVSFTPVVIKEGTVTLTHIKGESCQEDITFEAVGTNNRKANDTITIRAG